VSGELAIAQVLLIAAGLLLTSFARLLSVSPGFDPRDLVAADVSLPGAKYKEPEVKIRFHEDVLARLRATPGIDRAAMAMRAPMTPAITRGVRIDGQPAPRPGELQTMSFLTVSDGYFSATGMSVVRGRPIAREDDLRALEVIVVNEAFARRYFAGQDPIGHRVGYGPLDDPHYWHTVVGLIADSREQLAQSPLPTAYAPFRQNREPWNFASYLVKTALPVNTVRDILRRAVAASDADQPVSRVRAVESDMQESIAMQRFTTLIAALFAALALALAVVGTFGMMSHVVGGRTREIGVRMAMGATRLDIVSLVLGQAARIVAAAALAGLGSAILLGASLQALLFEVRPGDPRTLIATALVLMSTALAASYVPLRRVLAQNPLVSLRTE
jgi:putative ABC transport system permease protein